MNVLFICRGNALRSIIAETYLRSLQLPNITSISSAGTIAAANKANNLDNFQITKNILQDHGLERFIKEDYGQNLTQELINNADVIVSMNEVVSDEAVDLFTMPNTNITWNTIDVGEPGRLANTRAERIAFSNTIYSEIVASVNALLPSLR